MQKIPYGISDFSVIATEDYYFVDRTGYLEKLENLGEKYIFFLRPRRFGKSLWISILQHYYGQEHRARFEDLFGKYHIGHHPTPLANHYLVLRFEFSRIDTTSPEGTYQGFLRNTLQGVRQFLGTYPEMFEQEEIEEILSQTVPSEVLKVLFLTVQRHKQAIYLLIDEYDHFTNELISFNLSHFKEIVTQNGYVRKFFETIKTATGEGGVDRIFVTGVTPLTLDSLTSGFNIGSDLSRSPDLHEMMGFRQKEVKQLLNDFGIEQRPALLETLRHWYNGYQFSDEYTVTRLYNPDMILYFTKEYLKRGHLPKELLDKNIASDYGKIRRLFSIGGLESDRLAMLETLLDRGEITTQITSEFSFEKVFEAHDFLSLLYYMGLLTIKGPDLAEVRIGFPNAVIRQLYYAYFAQIVREQISEPSGILDVQAAVRDMARNNRPQAVLDLVAHTLEQLSNRDWRQFSEKHVKMVLLSFLVQSQLYTIKTEYESKQKFVDILLLKREPFPAPYQFAFELKYVKKSEAQYLDRIIEEGRVQLSAYRKHEDLQYLPDLKTWLIVFLGAELVHIEELT